MECRYPTLHANQNFFSKNCISHGKMFIQIKREGKLLEKFLIYYFFKAFLSLSQFKFTAITQDYDVEATK